VRISSPKKTTGRPSEGCGPERGRNTKPTEELLKNFLVFTRLLCALSHFSGKQGGERVKKRKETLMKKMGCAGERTTSDKGRMRGKKTRKHAPEVFILGAASDGVVALRPSHLERGKNTRRGT